MDWTDYRQLGIAALLGLLVGLQRERTRHATAGIRTFALITLFGAVIGLIGNNLNGSGTWVVAAGLLAVAGLMVMMNLGRLRSGESHPGPTTEAAALIMYGVGVLLALGMTGPALCVGGGVAVLLQWKKPLHEFVARFGEADMRAIFRLALVALVVLPVLPDRAYGPYGVLNPFHIWLMVVLIVGVSVAGYIAHKFLGAHAGTVLGGVLGGVVSSTATTVGYSRRTRNAPETAELTALVIAIASTIVFIRVGFEVALVSPSIAPVVLPPLGATMGLMTLVCLVLYLRRPAGGAVPPSDEDPSALTAAMVFGVLYAVIIFVLAAVKENFGSPGTYLVAVLSGLTDMDAITLSTTRLMEVGRIDTETGWRMILLAALSNMVFKGGLVAVLGHPRLLRRIIPAFGFPLAGGVLILFLWPN